MIPENCDGNEAKFDLTVFILLADFGIVSFPLLSKTSDYNESSLMEVICSIELLLLRITIHGDNGEPCSRREVCSMYCIWSMQWLMTGNNYTAGVV